jgi:hypothetical protein
MSRKPFSTDTLPTSDPSGLSSRWLDVTVSHIGGDNPLRLTFYLVLTLRDGVVKHSSKATIVTDTALQDRLRQEVKPGDQLRVCLETDWDADDIPTVLKDFCRV